MIVRKRLILYIIAFVLLVITAAIVIYTAQGYFFDFKTGKIKKQGIIVIRSIPKNANVYLDGKFKKNKTQYSIPLFPGAYEVKVKNEKYSTWTKRVNVESGVATMLDYVFLVLKNRTPEPVTTEGVKNLAISAKNPYEVAFVDMKNNVWIVDTKSNKHKKLYQSEEKDKEVQIKDWSANGKNLLISTVQEENLTTYKLLKESESKTLTNLPKDIKKIQFAQNSDTRFFFLADSYLYVLDESGSQIVENNTKEFAQNQNFIFFVKKTAEGNEIWQSSLDFKTKDKLQEEQNNKIALFPSKNKRLVYTVGQDNELFFLEKNSKQKINTGVLDVKWAKDDKKITYRTPQEIYVYNFESDNPKEPKSIITTRLSKNIDEIAWFYDFKHVVFRTGKEINLIDYDGENMTTLTDSSSGESFVTTKLGKYLIYTEEKDGAKNIKIMKLTE